MLIIGHRGAAGEKSPNTLTSIRAAVDAGVDMLEVDVRLTKDSILVLYHTDTLNKPDNSTGEKINALTYKQLQKRTGSTDSLICTLDEALRECLGSVMINIQLHDKGSGIAVLELLRKPSYIQYADLVLLSSFSIRELIKVRNLNKKIKLAMLMKLNPFAFLAWERKLHLSAVGFHRLHLNKLAVQAAHQLEIFVYVYTVNRKSSLVHLKKQGIDGVVTDYPSRFLS